MIYLDNAATAPLSQQTKEYLISILDDYGNPSSIHSEGQKARQVIEESRKSVANFINANPKDIIFTSGGSASNTLSIKGYIKTHNCTIFYSPLLHKSALECIKDCAFIPEKLKVNSCGQIDLEDFENRINPLKHKPFVIVEWANSEIGTIQNIKEIIRITHKHNGIVYVDCTGSIFQIPIDVKELNADMIGFSGHKLGALKGIGVLYKKPNIELQPLIYGTQEQGLVGGTLNILGIASLGKAVCEYDYSSISSKNRDYVYNYIIDNIPNSYLIGEPIEENRLRNNLYMCFKGVDGESLMMILDMNGIEVSTGSACSSGSLAPSSTLTTIGMDREDIHSCIRMSFSGNETKEELDYACETLSNCVNKLRKINGDINNEET